MPKKPVKVYLTTPQRETLTKIMKAEEISRSEVLRNAFLEYAYVRAWTSKKPKTMLQVGVR